MDGCRVLVYDRRSGGILRGINRGVRDETDVCTGGVGQMRWKPCGGSEVVTGLGCECCADCTRVESTWWYGKEENVQGKLNLGGEGGAQPDVRCSASNPAQNALCVAEL